MRLVKQVQQLLIASPQVLTSMGLQPFQNFPELLDSLFTSICNNPYIGEVIAEAYRAGANIAAGAIVIEDVEAGTLFVGSKAQHHGTARISFINA